MRPQPTQSYSAPVFLQYLARDLTIKTQDSKLAPPHLISRSQPFHIPNAAGAVNPPEQSRMEKLCHIQVFPQINRMTQYYVHTYIHEKGFLRQNTPYQS